MDRELTDKHEDLSSALITHIKPGCGSMYLYPRPGSDAGKSREALGMLVASLAENLW